MGLDARVYRSKASLPFDPDAVGAVLDFETGEYYFPAPATEAVREREFPPDTRIAVKKRLGNISLVASLRTTIEPLLAGQSIVLSKVLYSGTHCGDFIPVALMSDLQSELDLLRRHAQGCGDEPLLTFVVDMQALASAAINERNPIVF